MDRRLAAKMMKNRLFPRPKCRHLSNIRRPNRRRFPLHHTIFQAIKTGPPGLENPCPSMHFVARFIGPHARNPPLKIPQTKGQRTTFFSYDTAKKSHKSTMQFSENQAVNRSNPAPISRGLAMVKGGFYGAVAAAISPLTIPSPQAP